jgi:hypothetical protein
MAKNHTPAAPEFTSVKDLGYKQAATSDTLSKQAAYALEKIPGFPKDIPSESKAELYAGYFLRYSETHPPVTYAVINGHYVLATEEHKANKSVEKIEAGVDYAFAITAQEFGKLKNTEPEKHALIGGIRDKVQVYCSNKLGDLKRAAAKLQTAGESRTRETIDFTVSVSKAFDAFTKSVKTKHGKGDTTAKPAHFKLAVDAFWKSYNMN